MENKNKQGREKCLEEIAKESVHITLKYVNEIVIVGGSTKEKIYLTKYILELNKDIKIYYNDFRKECSGGDECSNGYYFIELDKINIIYPKD